VKGIVIPAHAGIHKIIKISAKVFMFQHKQYYVYILASRKNGTLYTGVTSDIIKRVYEHKNDLVEGFTKKYKVHELVYYEIFNSIEDAILKEKRIKKWKRNQKIELIEKENKEWKDLYNNLI